VGVLPPVDPTFCETDVTVGVGTTRFAGVVDREGVDGSPSHAPVKAAKIAKPVATPDKAIRVR
jgi:hypothetical protein